jgi:hypothetical protein
MGARPSRQNGNVFGRELHYRRLQTPFATLAMVILDVCKPHLQRLQTPFATPARVISGGGVLEMIIIIKPPMHDSA